MIAVPAFLLRRFVTSDQTSDSRAEKAVAARVMSRDAAYDCALQATLGDGRRDRDEQARNHRR